VVDADGTVWYQDFGDAVLGRLNPRTGEVKEWPIPEVKPFPPFHSGGLAVALDADGNPWLALMRQGAVAKFDKKTAKFTTWSLPAEYNGIAASVIMVAPASNGKVWFARLVQGLPRGSPRTSVNLPSLHLLDPKAGTIASYSVPGGIYGLEALPDGNAIVFSLLGNRVTEVDAKTGENIEHIPSTAGAGPRRGQIDHQGRAWFAEYYAGKVGMFDPKTKAIREWPVSTTPGDPYMVGVDKHGAVWMGGDFTDYVMRLDPASGKTTKFLMPTVDVNVRGINVDRADHPVIWIGENHQAKIIRIEPFDLNPMTAASGNAVTHHAMVPQSSTATVGALAIAHSGSLDRKR